jgi:hypothetical protein
MYQPNKDIETARRCKALNAIRLACLGPDTYRFAARTFGLQPAEIRTAEIMLDLWTSGDGRGATESEKVEYLLARGWMRADRRYS